MCQACGLVFGNNSVIPLLSKFDKTLQEKELQEEKKRKKHFPESSGVSAYGDSYYYEDGGNNSCL